MGAGKVHFDTGRRMSPNACGNYLRDDALLSVNPQATTCANCRHSKSWRKASGLPEPRPSVRPFRLHMGTAAGTTTLRASSSAPLDYLRDLMASKGMELVSESGPETP